MDSKTKVAILGGGNIGLAIANGLINSNLFPAQNIYITRKKVELLKEYANKGFIVTKDNILAVKNADVIIAAVQPQQLNELLQEIAPSLNSKKHILISVVSGASIKVMKQLINKKIPVILLLHRLPLCCLTFTAMLYASSHMKKGKPALP